MVPPIEYYLVGSALYKENPNDVDVCAVMDDRDFELAFGFNHQSLMDSYKEDPRGEKLKHYLEANRMAGWALSPFFGKKVDFKWCLRSMLYKPNIRMHLEADVTMHL